MNPELSSDQGKGLKYWDTAQRVAGDRQDRPQAMVFIGLT